MRRAALLVLILALTGCGLDIQSADLFVLTRTGQGHKLTLLVSDGGTITCNGGKQRTLPDRLLLQARDLVNSLSSDARAHLNIPPRPGSVFHYTIRLQAGTVSFPDTAAERHPTLAQAELFALQSAHQACGLTG
jgi:hypothetical protein